MRRGLIVILSLALAPITATAEQPIQPGAQVQIGGNLCTLNFVFADASTTYIGTAGHCGKVGKRASGSGGEFGTLRFSRHDDSLDFALIEVDAARVGQVSPEVRGFGAVKGAASPQETTLGDEVFVHGYGVGVGATALTRSRTGLLLQDTDEWYTANMPAVNGDSGGPVVHVGTKKALGVISTYGFVHGHPATDRGPTVSHILRELRAAGFKVALV